LVVVVVEMFALTLPPRFVKPLLPETFSLVVLSCVLVDVVLVGLLLLDDMTYFRPALETRYRRRSVLGCPDASRRPVEVDGSRATAPLE
jgi:hypothetical protein